MLNNYNLCHMKTINWDEIITGPGAQFLYVYNFTLPERECPPCDKSCERGCWGEGPENCQKFSKVNCSPQCSDGRCFGPKPRDCCHLFCAGGCTGPKQSDCLVSALTCCQSCVTPTQRQLNKLLLQVKFGASSCPSLWIIYLKNTSLYSLSIFCKLLGTVASLLQIVSLR